MWNGKEDARFFNGLLFLLGIGMFIMNFILQTTPRVIMGFGYFLIIMISLVNYIYFRRDWEWKINIKETERFVK